MAEADPVEAKSGFLKMYMSNHPDTLVAYAKFYGKVEGIITGAEMTSITTKGMTLAYTRKAGGEKTEVYVPIEPPMTGYDDVKPRLLEMKALAQEGLGMIKAPKITTYVFPKEAWKVGVFIILIGYITFAPMAAPSVYLQPGQYLHALIGMPSLKLAWGVAALMHTFESVYTVSLCRRHDTGFFVSAAYVLTTFIFGAPTWMLLRRRIQAARIESVMKIE